MEESEAAVNEASPIRKLALFSLPSQPPEPPGILTPPLLTSVSVPFQWEEAPGKPRHSGEGAEPKAKCARSLELPPRMLVGSSDAKVTNMPSPTTVLDGPEVGRTLSFSYALRSPSKEIKGGRGGGGSGMFGSKRWAGFRKNKEAGEGGFDFLSTDNGGDQTKVKITRVKRKASFFNGAHHSRSHMWELEINYILMESLFSAPVISTVDFDVDLTETFSRVKIDGGDDRPAYMKA